jgi:hypothetical protein
MNFYKIERHFLKNNEGMTYQDLLEMPFFEFIYKLNMTEEELKEKQKQQEKEKKEQEKQQHEQQKKSKDFKPAKAPSAPKVNPPKNIK